MIWWPPLNEQFRQLVQHDIGAQVPRHHDRQALSGELIDDRKHPDLLVVVGAALDEVV